MEVITGRGVGVMVGVLVGLGVLVGVGVCVMVGVSVAVAVAVAVSVIVGGGVLVASVTWIGTEHAAAIIARLVKKQDIKRGLVFIGSLLSISIEFILAKTDCQSQIINCQKLSFLTLNLRFHIIKTR